MVNGAKGFGPGFWQMFAILSIVNLIDRLLIDEYWVGHTNAYEEMEMLDKAFEAIIARTPDFPMPNWRALKAQTPDWETIRKQYRKA